MSEHSFFLNMFVVDGDDVEDDVEEGDQEMLRVKSMESIIIFLAERLSRRGLKGVPL